MEWGITEIGQLLLYIMALGLPTAWVMGWLYRVWRKANMPAILGVLNRQRRRDRVIKETRTRADAFESKQAKVENRLFAMELQLLNLESRLGKMETLNAQLRQKLRSRGVLTDA